MIRKTAANLKKSASKRDMKISTIATRCVAIGRNFRQFSRGHGPFAAIVKQMCGAEASQGAPSAAGQGHFALLSMEFGTNVKPRREFVFFDRFFGTPGRMAS